MGIAFILVNCDMGHEMETVERLKEVCSGVQGTYGVHDFVCKIHYDTMDDFEAVLHKIRQIQRITHTITIHTIPEQGKN